MKLVRKDGTVPAIFFPPGAVVEGGSCQYSTKTCREVCPAQKSPLVDEIYKFFTENVSIVIAGQIVQEMHTTYPDKVLHWFSSGDCEPHMQDKIVEIIKFISMSGIIQCGFTRNVKFWKAVDRANINIILTVENLKEAKEKYAGHIIGIPQYKTGVVKLYEIIKGEPTRVLIRGGCGGSWYEDRPDAEPTKARGLITEPDCTECYINKRGCFFNYKNTP